MRDRLNELQRIAQSLMSRGGALDRSPVAEQRAALEALQLLGSLAETTRSSLAQQPGAQTPASPTQKAASTSTQAQTQAPAPRVAQPAPPLAQPAGPRPSAPYGTQKQEYRPALKNENLVGALLEYYQRSRSTRPGSRNLIKADQVDSYGNGLFQTPSIPHVDVRPKDGLMPRRAPDLAAQPILRPTRPARPAPPSGDEN